jgi:hypothetical protein
MALPYENVTSGAKAMDEIQKILQRFGCSSFGHMTDFQEGKLIVQFKYNETPISVEASFNGYAAAWLKENPYSSKRHSTKTEWDKRALDKGNMAVYSILRDWIKGQVTAIECGILSFQGAFLGQILLPSGMTVLQHVNSKNLLSPPRGNENDN